jgi:hypothetical protein
MIRSSEPGKGRESKAVKTRYLSSPIAIPARHRPPQGTPARAAGDADGSDAGTGCAAMKMAANNGTTIAFLIRLEC